MKELLSELHDIQERLDEIKAITRSRNSNLGIEERRMLGYEYGNLLEDREYIYEQIEARDE